MALVNGKQILNDSIGIVKLKDDASQGTILFGAGTMIGLTDAPTVGTDVANKDYVDSVAAGLDPKESVRLATVSGDADLTDAGGFNGTYVASGGTNGADAFTGGTLSALSIDGITPSVGDRLLIKNQTDAKQNGIYSVISGGAGTSEIERASDQDGTPTNEVSSGNFTFVETGNTQGGQGWVLLGDGELTLNTDDLNWAQFSESTSLTGGNGINVNGSTIDADADEVTITATGGTGNVQLEVIKVPNALSQGTGIATFSYDGSGTATVAIDNTGVVAGTYGSASIDDATSDDVAIFTVNAQGQITSATTVPILITKSQISDYDTERFVTGGTYSNGTALITFTDNLANTFTVDLSSMDQNDTFITAGTISYVGANGTITLTDSDNNTVSITGITDCCTTGATLINNTLYFDTNQSLSAYSADLSSLAVDLNTFTTGATLIGSTAYFDTNASLSAYTLDLSSLDVNDTVVTGGTYSNATALITFTDNDGGTFTVDLSSMDQNDTFVTAGTYSNATGLITFDGANSFSQFTVDLSSMDQNDTYVTGGTVFGTSGVLRYTDTDLQTFDVSGVTFTLNTSDGVTADTSTVAIGGTVNVGFDPDTALLPSPTSDDKNQTVTATTSGNNALTGVFIANTPHAGSYVTVSVNGVGPYILGDGTTATTVDCYFGTEPTTARSIATITSGDQLFWNGTAVGFNLETTDVIDFEYNVLQ